MNIGMIGHGMMGVWHSDALQQRKDVVLHTAVGRRPEPTAEFAARFGYRKHTTDLDSMLADPEVEAVIIASPSEQHEDHAIRCLEAGKHTLIEIPIALSLKGAERVVEAGQRSGKVYGLCHPMRFRREREPMRERIAKGEEKIRHMAGRFFIHRLKNVGATGYQRSWTDNILWHHFCHFVDVFSWMLEGETVARVQSYMSQPHPVTGIPMECVVLVETASDQSWLVHGSYHSTFRLYDKLFVTDRDSYFFDIVNGSLQTRDGTAQMEDEEHNCWRVTFDFLDAIKEGRQPRASGPSVLPAMRILQTVQDDWDARHGARGLPGRPL